MQKPQASHIPRPSRLLDSRPIGVPLLTILALLGFASLASAIPTQPTAPHDHSNPGTTDLHTTWIDPRPPAEAVPDPDPDNPDAKGHQHRDRHPLNGQLIPNTGGDATNPVTTHPAAPGGVALGFTTYAVRDDRAWRYDAANDRSLEHYAQGFIAEGRDVRYQFVDALPPNFRYDATNPPPGEGRWNTDADAMRMRQVIEAAFTMWEDAVNGYGVNVNGVPIVTRIGFEPVDANTRNQADIYIHLGAPGLLLGQWVPRFQYLAFRFQVWDYDPADGIAANRADFRSVALHEIGHALGLGHFGTDRSVNLMAGIGLADGVVGAGIDAGSLDGVKDLYSIPTPEPATLTLFAIGALGLLGYRRWRRPA